MRFFKEIEVIPDQENRLLHLHLHDSQYTGTLKMEKSNFHSRDNNYASNSDNQNLHSLALQLQLRKLQVLNGATQN